MKNDIKESKKYLNEIIQKIYAIELIFQDLKNYEINLNKNDEKFIIPYEEERKYLEEELKKFYNQSTYFTRIYNMINNQAKKTLKNNSQNLDRLKQYAWKLANED